MASGYNANINLEKGAVLLFDKPLYWTSFNLVNKVKTVLKRSMGLKKIKVGHAGTLDPLASGLLIVCIGKATRQVTELQNHSKIYIAKIRLGATTPSFDLETSIDAKYPTGHIDLDGIREALQRFIGVNMQVPPTFSAKLVEGKRAYDLARKGIEMALQPVPVEIKRITVLNYSEPYLTIEVECSKGTYIRALARDIGVALKSGGHLVELKRTASGPYKLTDAITVEEFESMFSKPQTRKVET